MTLPMALHLRCRDRASLSRRHQPVITVTRIGFAAARRVTLP
jgi:hypothetical protein